MSEMYYVHKHAVALQYGGPEEGGWWFTAGDPVEGWQVLEFADEDAAYEVCRKLHEEEYARREREEDYSFSSVLASRSDHFEYRVEEFATPRAYPERTPHYE